MYYANMAARNWVCLGLWSPYAENMEVSESVYSNVHWVMEFRKGVAKVSEILAKQSVYQKKTLMNCKQN